VRGKHFVDVSGRDGGVPGGYRNLVQVRYNIACGVQSFDRRALMFIDFEATHFVYRCRSDSTLHPSAGVEDDEAFPRTSRHHADFVVADLKAGQARYQADTRFLQIF
jgi:hypothetical protein